MLVGIPPYYTPDLKALYKNIQKGKLKLPSYLSSSAKKVLSGLLSRDPTKRINLNDLVEHEFFSDIDFIKLSKKQLNPPVVLQKITKPKKEESSHKAALMKIFAAAEEEEEKHEDEDYTENNRIVNRIKNYSFSS